MIVRNIILKSVRKETLFILDNDKRLDTINKIDAEIASQKFFIRFSYKSKYISHNNYFEWSKRLDEIGKILGGWIKSCLKE